MPRDSREESGFRHKDEIDDLFGSAYPNLQRIGCPEKEAIQAAARRKLPMEHQVYEHLSQCSECYREFRAYQQSGASSLWVRSAIAAAVVFAVTAVGGVYAGRTFGIGPWSGKTESMVLDYRNEGVTRGEAGEATRPARTLPRKNLDLTILPPIGSEPGAYELRMVGETGKVLLVRSATGELANFEVRVRTNLDLRSFSVGPYSLEIRLTGENWDPRPVIIR
jgi:hypothetical protein